MLTQLGAVHELVAFLFECCPLLVDLTKAGAFFGGEVVGPVGHSNFFRSQEKGLPHAVSVRLSRVRLMKVIDQLSSLNQRAKVQQWLIWLSNGLLRG